MRFLIIFVIATLMSQHTFAQTQTAKDDELEAYMDLNYIKEYVPATSVPLTITGNKRMTFAYYSALVPSDFGAISDYEFQFAYNIGTFWLESVIGQGKAQFGAVGSNSSSGLEGQFIREDELEESYLYLGIGGSLQSRHLTSLFGFDRVFETFTGYVTYHTLSETLREEDYAGFGARADAAVNYLLSNNSHIGVRFSFGFSSLKRAQASETEVSAERSLMFRWNRIGADYSFYF